MSQVTTEGGGGTISGSGSADEVTIWTNATTLKGEAGLKYAASKLSVSNRVDVGDVGAAGTIENSNTNQNLQLEVSGTGLVEVENQTVNNDSTFQVKGNGTGTPKLQLTNPSKAVTMQCDENQKLKVKGGSDSFVFDVSSSTGGITFPDSTVQNTAASGGPSPGALQSVQCLWSGQTNPWLTVNEANLGWDDSLTITASNHLNVWTNQADAGCVTYYPIYFPQDIEIDYIGVVAGNVTGGTINYSIFASDANNFPTGSSLLDFTTTSSSSAYTHIEVSVSDTSFSKGLHFLALDAATGGTFLLGNFAAGSCPVNTVNNVNYKIGPAVTPFCNFSDATDSLTSLANQSFSYYLAETSATSIPATIDLADIVLGGRDRDAQFYKGMCIPSLFVRRST